MILSYGTSETCFAKECWDSQRRYAERVGVPYVQLIVDKDPFPHRLKLELILKHGPKIGKVLYLDWDVFVKDSAEDVFKIEAPFSSLGYNGKIPWSCTAIMIADISIYKKMYPEYLRYFEHLPDNTFREEIATNYAAIEVGAGLNQIRPSGFKHKGGQRKYEEEGKSPLLPYVPFGRGKTLYWNPDGRNRMQDEGHPVYIKMQ